MINKKVSDKIKKLLDLANSDNQHEAELAAKRATEIMTKYNLTSADLQNNTYETDSLFEAGRTPVEAKFVMEILKRCFFVAVWTHKSRITGKLQVFGKVYGEETNVQTALYVGAYLMRSMPQLWKSYKAETGAKAAHRQAFYLGFTRGLIEQLEEAQAMVVRKESEAAGKMMVLQTDPALTERVSGMNRQRKTIRSNDAAQNDGHAAGKQFRISRGVGSSDGNQGKLIG